MPATDEDLLFEQSYLIDVLPKASLGMSLAATDNDSSLPTALVSAAYGYTRGGLHSPLYAALFGFFGYQYPLISALIVSVDAVFLNNTPAARAARNLYEQHGSKLNTRFGFSGVSGHSRCKNGYRRRHGVCRKVR